MVELIQNDLNTKSLKNALHQLLDKTHRERLFAHYFELETRLGGAGASLKTAKAIVNSLGDK